MTFGDQVGGAEAAQMVQTAREAGITMFDTSNNYSDGMSEEMLGTIVAPFRNEVLISTKGGSHVDQDDPELSGLSRKALRKAIDGSLQRLGVETIDVYYLHRPDRHTPIEETLSFMAEVVQSGKVRYVGQSNYAAWQITEMAYLSRANGWPEVQLSQQMYNLLGRRIESEYVECAERLGLTTVAYNPLAGGLLTGKHSLNSNPSSGSRFSKKLYRDRYWNSAQFEALTRLQAIASDAGITLIELAYRWVLGRPSTQAMLVGASSSQQLKENLAAIEGKPVAQETLDACDEVWATLEGAAPKYNR